MQTQDKTYNGWANYATWRVNLEMFDGYDPDGTPMTAQSAEDYVIEMLDAALPDTGLGLILSGWVDTFLQDVDWQEIADAINKAHDLTDPDDDTDA